MTVKKKLDKNWWQSGGKPKTVTFPEPKPANVTLEDFEVFRSEENYDSLEDIPNLISVAAMAKKFNVSTSTLRQDIRRGLLPATKFGHVWRIDPRNIKSYLAAKREFLQQSA